MKKITLILVLAACRWKPSVTSVPVTAPWTAMNLPVEKGNSNAT